MLNGARNILIVDDDAALREILAIKIRSLGYNTLQAEDGAVAVDIVGRGGIDLVISDVQMPVADGVEMLQQIRKQHGASPPIILTSGYTDYPVWQMHEWGADAFLGKPFALNLLETLLPQLLAAPSEQWLPQPEASVSNSILTLSFDSAASMKSSIGVEFGRRGMFVGIVRSDLARGKMVTFHIKLPASVGHSEIAGVGVVRWARASKMADLAPGVGIEFVSLSPESKKFVLENCRKNGIISVIPMGPSAQSGRLVVVK